MLVARTMDGALRAAGRPVDRQQDPVLVTGLGLRIPPELSYERWERVGHQLSGIVDSSAWWLGDWLVFGKHHYADRYQRAIRTAGLSYQTLRNYAWVARQFSIPARRSALSFQHHAEVASFPLETREKWLDRAEACSWSTKQLRKCIRDERVRPVQPQPAVSLIPRIEVPSHHLDRWRRAADESGVGLEHWVLSMLDQAAVEALTDA